MTSSSIFSLYYCLFIIWIFITSFILFVSSIWVFKEMIYSSNLLSCWINSSSSLFKSLDISLIWLVKISSLFYASFIFIFKWETYSSAFSSYFLYLSRAHKNSSSGSTITFPISSFVSIWHDEILYSHSITSSSLYLLAWFGCVITKRDIVK
jgi:hypothetical protein